MNKTRRRAGPTVVLLVAGMALGACQKKADDAPAVQAPDAAAGGSFELPESDVRMIAAREMARVSVTGFIDAVRTPSASRSQFSLRTGAAGGTPVWLGEVRYDGHLFRGRMRPAPTQPGGTLGAEMTVKRPDISDWLYVENGRLVGGFTVRALRDSLPPGKRAELEKRLPFRIE